MQIRITKKGNKGLLSCTRQDGTNTTHTLGPDFPHHDMAHFIVESKFKLKDGFFGSIQQGRSIDELNDKEVIKGLGPETWLAEILTRNLQAVCSGAVNARDYEEIVRWELERFDGIKFPGVTEEEVLNMKSELESLATQWDNLSEHGSMIFTFENPT